MAETLALNAAKDVATDASPALNEGKKIFQTIAGNSGRLEAIGLASLAALTVIGVEETRHAYTNHEEKEHLEEIYGVLSIHTDFLSNIDLGDGVKFSFPIPFEKKNKDDKDKSIFYKSLSMNKDIRDALAIDHSTKSDTFLKQKNAKITNAIKLVLRYYDDRGKEDDVTANFLTYLAVILSQNCTKMQGYQEDIILLKQINLAINAFASMPPTGIWEWIKKKVWKPTDPKDRQRYERLTAVYMQLEEAKKLLDDHLNSRTLKDDIDSLSSYLYEDAIPSTLNLVTKTIVPEKLWKTVETAIDEEMAAGILRPEYKTTHEKKISIPESIFKIWIQRLEANHISYNLEGSNIFVWNEHDLTLIQKLFNECPNFLNYKAPAPKANGKYETDRLVVVGNDHECLFKVLPKLPLMAEPYSFLIIHDASGMKLYEVGSDAKKPVLIENMALVPGLAEALKSGNQNHINKALTVYRNHRQTVSRTEAYTENFLFVDLLNDFEDYVDGISDLIRDIGEIYVENPHHCNFIFDTLNGLNLLIQERIGKITKNASVIGEEQRGKDMMARPDLSLREKYEKTLDIIYKKVKSKVNDAMEKHYAHNKRWGKSHTSGEIDPNYYADNRQRQAIQKVLSRAVDLHTKFNFINPKYQIKPGSLPASPRESKDDLNFPIGVPAPAPVVLTTDVVLFNIRQKLDLIKHEEVPDEATAAAYEQLYNALSEMDVKSTRTLREDDLGRRTKGQSARDLTLTLCTHYFAFLSQPLKARREGALVFSRDQVQAELIASRNAFIDDFYQDTLGKVFKAAKQIARCLFFGYGLYDWAKHGFLRTGTREAVEQVTESCENLAAKMMAATAA